MNKSLEGKRVEVLNEFGLDSSEMKKYESEVEKLHEYSLEQAEKLLNDFAFPSKEFLGFEGYRYFLQVINFGNQEFLKKYWTEIEEGYFLGDLPDSRFQMLKEKVE